MIVWPREEELRSDGREGLRVFRETAACAELEASPLTWTVTAWPWTFEHPIRIGLENEAKESVAVHIGEGGLWRMVHVGRDVHERTAAERAREAFGDGQTHARAPL